MIKYDMIKHLILLKTENMMNIKGVVLQCFLNFVITKASGANTSGGAVKSEIISNQELAEELIEPTENLRNKKYVHLYTIFGLLILPLFI